MQPISSARCTQASGKLAFLGLWLCGATKKLIKLWRTQKTTYEDVHASVEAVVDDELMSHFYAERFHRVLWRIVVRTDLVVVEV